MDFRPLTLFYSYAHADEDLRDRLATHLALLKRNGVIAEWHDRQIVVGEEWDGKIRGHLETANIVLFLVSADFLASDYCWDVEVKRAMQRHEDGDARVIPVVLRDCDWTGAPFGKIQGAPKNARPVTSWPNQDEAFTDVARAIRRAAEAIRVQPPPPLPSKPSLWTLPQSTQTFTGREDRLADVRAALAAGDRVALTALAGLGGIGKTQIALEFARRHRDDYDVGWFVRAEDAAVLRNDLSALAIALGIAAPDSGPDATFAALRDWWRTHDRWLLVFDNAEDRDAVRPYLPTEGRGHVLITSRAQGWGGVATKVEVHRLPRAEAVALLLARAEIKDPTEAQREVAGRVAAELGDLPLALEQAAAYVDDAGISFDDYLATYRARRDALHREGRLSTDYSETVATTWSLSFEKAEAESPAAGGLLRLCACLAPDNIPADLIRQWDEPWPGPLDAIRTDPTAWAGALAAIRRHSLVRVDDDGRLSVHRLIQAVTFDRIDEKERELWITAAQRLMRRAMSADDPEMVIRLDEFAALVPHALAVAEADGGDDHFRSNLFDRVANVSELRGDYPESEVLFRRALTVAEAIYEPDHPVIAVRVNNLGYVLQAQSDFAAAEEAYRRALAIGEAAYGADHPQVAIYTNNLGDVLKMRGDINAAEEAYRRALAIGEAAYGADHPQVAIYANNLGRVLLERGDLDAAEEAYRRALAIGEATYGADHPQVAIYANNLGHVLLEHRDIDGAEAAYRRALAIFEGVLGPDHPHAQVVRDSLSALRP